MTSPRDLQAPDYDSHPRASCQIVAVRCPAVDPRDMKSYDKRALLQGI